MARILEENTSLAAGHDGYFINNLLVFNVDDINSWSYVNVGPNTLPGSFTFGWNLWYSLDDPAFSGPVYQGCVPSETNAVIQQNPILADLDNGDYHIPLTSPARGKGTDVPGGDVADYDCVAFAVPPSMGAFEAR